MKWRDFLVRGSVLILVLVTAHAEVDPRAWKELDLVPMPKEIRLSDEWLELDPQKTAIVLGAQAEPKTRRGAEWLNRRIEALGGKPLPVLVEGAPEAEGRFLIVIGTREDHPRLGAAVTRGELNVEEGNPGIAGYQIARNGRELQLAGADAQGALYACVTLGELLEPGTVPKARLCGVRDWPDFHALTVMPGAKGSSRYTGAVALRRALADKTSSEALRNACLEEFRETLHYMLRRKLPTYFVQSQSVGGEAGLFAMSPYAKETLRLCLEMGREWGIRSFYYAGEPFVGLKKDLPAVDPALIVKDSYESSGRYKEWVRSWSMDAERRQHARRLAKVIKEIGIDIFGFHDTDNGLPENPAQWDFRGEADRKRWGNDYAAAVLNSHRIYFEELQRENPGLEVHFTIMPYNIRNLADPPPVLPGWTESSTRALREKTLALWRTLDAGFPKESVSFAIREAAPDAVRHYRQNMPGRPVLTWYGMAAGTFFNNAPAWLETFFDQNRHDILFTGQDYIGHGVVPLLNLAMREYGWNVQSPGSAPFPADYESLHPARNRTDTDTFRVVLPRLARNVFGREIAPDVVAALEQNVSPYVVFSRRKKPGMDDRTEARMASEHRRAKAAAEALDRAWAKVQADPAPLQRSDADAFAALVYLREVHHATRWVAAIKEQLYRAEELLRASRYEEALAALAEGQALRKEGVSSLQIVEAQKPPKLQIPSTFAIGNALKEELNDATDGLFDSLRERVVRAQKSGSFPALEFQALRKKNRTVPVVTLSAAPVLDGEAGREEWKGTYPVGTLFEGAPGVTPTGAPAEVRVGQHGGALYVAFKAPYLPGESGATARSRELVRVYLRMGGAEEPLRVIEIFERGLVYALPPSFADDVEYRIRQGKDAWEAELRIPTGREVATGGEPWRLLVARGYGGEALGGVNALLPLGPELAGSFRNMTNSVAAFPTLKPVKEPFTPTAGELAVDQVSLGLETLDDGIFSVLRFKARVQTGRMLEGAVLEVELKTSEGKSLARQRILDGVRIPYAVETGLREMVSQTPVEEALLSLHLTTPEGETSQTFHIRQAKKGNKAITEAVAVEPKPREAAIR